MCIYPVLSYFGLVVLFFSGVVLTVKLIHWLYEFVQKSRALFEEFDVKYVYRCDSFRVNESFHVNAVLGDIQTLKERTDQLKKQREYAFTEIENLQKRVFELEKAQPKPRKKKS